jgi:myo-inositol-1(or 4)-monophosphatase
MNALEKAIIFAVKAHEGQLRKDGSPFILHPLEVAVNAGRITDDIDVMAAAVLHDTVEDTDVTAQDILENFGENIAAIVAGETENKRPEISASESWKIRKEESLRELKDSDIKIKQLWLADKLANMRALYCDYDRIGDLVFARFNEKDPKEQRWYHETVLKYISELSYTEAYEEYMELFKKVFGE